MAKRIFTKKFKEDLIKYGRSFYDVNKEKHIPNPYFEKCREEDYKDLKCNTCQFRRDCNEGEEKWEENENITEDLIKEIIRCIESKETKLNEEAVSIPSKIKR